MLKAKLNQIARDFVGGNSWSELREFIEQTTKDLNHGDMERWNAALTSLENGSATNVRDCLMQLHPWRKGPLDVLKTRIDTEWRSDWKWERLMQKGVNFRGKFVLDVGCGNGFYMFKMLEAGATSAVGVDPTLLFAAQFLAQLIDNPTDRLAFIPAGLEKCPPTNEAFDLVVSMGVLYHRKDQRQHLLDLIERTKNGGQILLETMVLEGDDKEELVPHLVGNKRYAQMRNVWSIPTLSLLEERMTECGYQNIQLLDCEYTSLEEQRTTEWMIFQSLPDFLDPQDRRKTVEGHQAPKRAILIADKS